MSTQEGGIERVETGFGREAAIRHITQRLFELKYTNPRMLQDGLPKINGIGAHYPYTRAASHIDWCGYIQLRVFEEEGFQIHKDIHEAYKIANTKTLTELIWGRAGEGRHYTEAVRPDGHELYGEPPDNIRWVAFGPECSAYGPEEGDIPILKSPGHIAYVHRVLPMMALTIEGNRGNKIGFDYWYLDNRGGRISFYLRVLKAGVGS